MLQPVAAGNRRAIKCQDLPETFAACLDELSGIWSGTMGQIFIDTMAHDASRYFPRIVSQPMIPHSE